jgi:predicted Zn-dependent protease with MMP-like domain
VDTLDTHLPVSTARPKAIRVRLRDVRSAPAATLEALARRLTPHGDAASSVRTLGDRTRDTTTGATRGQGEFAARAGVVVRRYGAAVHVSRRRFEELVASALDELPEPLLAHTENVVVLVEDEPTAAQRTDIGGASILGLYEGVAQTDRGLDSPFLPDRITLFRHTLAAASADEDELVDQIHVTLVHEFAHHFGIDDERLDELGWY